MAGGRCREMRSRPLMISAMWGRCGIEGSGDAQRGRMPGAAPSGGVAGTGSCCDPPVVALPLGNGLGDDDLVDDELVLRVVSDSPISDEELAELTRQLKDDLNDLPGVSATELVTPAKDGTRGAGDILIGALAISVFAYPTAMRVKADLKHLADIIRRHQQRHRGKRVRITLPDGTQVDAENISEKSLAEVLRSVPHRGGSVEQESHID